MNNQNILLIILCKFELGKLVTKVVENIIMMLEEGDINTKTFQHWFVKFRTADFSLGNEP